MKKFKKKLLFLSSVLTTSSILTVAGACSNSSTNKTELLNSMKNDQTVEALKTKFDGYSTDAMEIIGSKAEINDQSGDLIQAFNEYFGTKLSFTQYGNGTNPGEILTQKFASSGGVGNVLLFAIEPKSEFEKHDKYTINSDAKIVLEIDKNIPGTIEVGNKKFMPQVYEYYGVVYNKDLFNEKDVVVYEGKSFAQVKASNSNFNLIKNNNYNGTIESEGKLYVFTNDLKEEGYIKVVEFLKSKGVTSPFYSLAKAQKQYLWPISTHLIAGAISTISQPKENEWNQADKVITPEMINTVKNALKIMGYQEGDDQAKQNNVDSGLASLAVNQTAMIQGGTFSEPDVKRTNKNIKLGLFPLPIFNKIDQTAMVYRGAAQKWAITTLAKDEAKLKTAKMFLQFLYKTKSGYNYLSKVFKFISPYNAPEGILNSVDQNSLLTSAANYEGDTNVGNWVHQNFPDGFNTDNDILAQVSNKGYAAENAYEKIKDTYEDLYKKHLENNKKRNL
ncbi:hypothetical protein [Mycoplasmopsis cricetuli]|uniref:hypothetical protein n=1 Tax=Mycoplasmopsis cricetuli TaxID=171283 RepID=UPI0004727C60|nr:hypothetical protein [Mycoplasmopsis cricetuli]